MKKFKLRGPRMYYFALGLVHALFGAMLGSWYPLIAAVQESMDLGGMELGFGLSGLAAGLFVGVFGSSLLIGRWALPVCCVAVTVLCLAIALPGKAGGWQAVQGWQALFVALVPLGLANGFLASSMNLLANGFARRIARLVQGRLNAALTIGGAVAGLAAGFALKNTVSPETHLTWVAIVGTAMAVVACALLGSNAGEGRGSEASADPPQPIGMWIVPLCGLALAGFVIQGVYADWHGPYMTKAGIPLAASFGFMAFAVGEAIARFATDALASRFGPQRVAFVSGLSAIAGAALFLSAEYVPLALVKSLLALGGAVLLGAGVGPVFPLALAAIGNRPGGVTALSTTGYAGMVVVPPPIGFLADEYGYQVALGVVLLPLAVVVALLAKATRTRP